MPIIAVSFHYLLKLSLSFARLRGLGLLGFASGLSGADGTAALLHARTRVDSRFPDMAIGTYPPRFFVAAGGHHLRRQRAVEGLVPLFGDERLNGREIIEPRQHLSVGAVRAAVAPLHALRRLSRLRRETKRTK